MCIHIPGLCVYSYSCAWIMLLFLSFNLESQAISFVLISKFWISSNSYCFEFRFWISSNRCCFEFKFWVSSNRCCSECKFWIQRNILLRNSICVRISNNTCCFETLDRFAFEANAIVLNSIFWISSNRCFEFYVGLHLKQRLLFWIQIFESQAIDVSNFISVCIWSKGYCFEFELNFKPWLLFWISNSHAILWCANNFNLRACTHARLEVWQHVFFLVRDIWSETREKHLYISQNKRKTFIY
jgi:hypothetical protein